MSPRPRYRMKPGGHQKKVEAAPEAKGVQLQVEAAVDVQLQVEAAVEQEVMVLTVLVEAAMDAPAVRVMSVLVEVTAS